MIVLEREGASSASPIRKPLLRRSRSRQRDEEPNGEAQDDESEKAPREAEENGRNRPAGDSEYDGWVATPGIAEHRCRIQSDENCAG